ncbi:hypothetical protein B0H13DRAFT_1885649 [Mycena leptocephala]|nr:hypothetical protein B0H13DRAFT_1925366 [Mycena leptocephala]KAJ7895326.1 hypothetical protein B0H13DRAFT_1885649 [Mycena leptocephala]
MYLAARAAALEVILELEESLADGKESAGDILGIGILTRLLTRRLSVLRDEEEYKGRAAVGSSRSPGRSVQRLVRATGRGDQMKEGRPNPNLSGIRANETRSDDSDSHDSLTRSRETKDDSDADRGRETEDGGTLENEGEDAVEEGAADYAAERERRRLIPRARGARV